MSEDPFQRPLTPAELLRGMREGKKTHAAPETFAAVARRLIIDAKTPSAPVPPPAPAERLPNPEDLIEKMTMFRAELGAEGGPVLYARAEGRLQGDELNHETRLFHFLDESFHYTLHNLQGRVRISATRPTVPTDLQEPIETLSTLKPGEGQIFFADDEPTPDGGEPMRNILIVAKGRDFDPDYRTVYAFSIPQEEARDLETTDVDYWAPVAAHFQQEGAPTCSLEGIRTISRTELTREAMEAVVMLNADSHESLDDILAENLQAATRNIKLVNEYYRTHRMPWEKQEPRRDIPPPPPGPSVIPQPTAAPAPPVESRTAERPPINPERLIGHIPMCIFESWQIEGRRKKRRTPWTTVGGDSIVHNDYFGKNQADNTLTQTFYGMAPSAQDLLNNLQHSLLDYQGGKELRGAAQWVQQLKPTEGIILYSDDESLGLRNISIVFRNKNTDKLAPEESHSTLTFSVPLALLYDTRMPDIAAWAPFIEHYTDNGKSRIPDQNREVTREELSGIRTMATAELAPEALLHILHYNSPYQKIPFGQFEQVGATDRQAMEAMNIRQRFGSR